MNEQNLIPTNKRSKEEARELGRKGGINSGKTRREKRTMKQLIDLTLSRMITNKKGETASTKEVIAIQLVNKAANGDLKAIDLVTKLIGEQIVRTETELSVKKDKYDGMNAQELTEEARRIMESMED